MAVMSSPISIATELSVVAQPRVGAFDHPAQPEPHRLGRGGGAGLGAELDVEIVEAATGELGADLGVVVAPVEVQGLDLLEQACPRQVLEGGVEQFDVVAVRSVEGPADRDAVGIGCNGPLPADFCRSVGFLPVPSPPQGALWMDPSSATSERSRPMIRS